ncbi:hypothetical protein A3H65_01265 [Candidatus Giovannonibacteria bacterium RIFCSPLOWO2_02_FULL_45_14]|uniref:Uncharacterized protein n=1 Tax=Candidatus Giovannonibacteria bacterium RIFCSPLOWO2_12_FULL_44_15 TaxID=1798364 RepID=A0A1F5Y0X4_9BACT|nr:MAG: hypothetical protein A3C75_00855 [Candidatus Giovannonibacteria bacterium RIFCSPHIGHO2_02_FULL_44_31]OGF76411.1 MAG: hypothetical protein A3E62_00835 [Candidatus Giovannonibacteria bacterium RIFCSPHIGHO2_12_FULL_44_29]OGF91083.1 MAG: hypothetical protein A3H65_01265 [Candidatus Giovannonibacteria bacterium RIFCSPLOWO2_02_FULL_45_14]OGF93780.1 MAG: hypothetical protein A3G54_02630 [Candidatus Giovannonibacteria bacterium RIFCSPLOWO2_12_FULL_44_15]
MDKNKEKKISDFFIGRLNQYHKLKYQIDVNLKENLRDPDIDAYAISKNLWTLNLQIKTGEPELKKFFGVSEKKGKTRIGIISTKNIFEDIEKIIRQAEKQYSNKKNLVLLIADEFSPSFDQGFARKIPREPYEFKGIYLVKLKNPYDEGQVVAIKDIFGFHGEVF